MLRTRFIELLTEKGWSLEQFSEISGVPFETAKNIKLGKTTNPRLDTLEKMSETFGVGINCLIGKCQHTTEEKILLRNFKTCGDTGKSLISLIARYEAHVMKNQRDTKEGFLRPCLIPNGDIRKGIIYKNCDQEEIIVPIKEAYVAIKMINNDLSPIYCENDIILIEDRFPENGERAVFMRNGRAYIRKFVKENGCYRLKCLHNHGEDLVLKRMDEVEYIGTCIDVIQA